MEKLKKAIIEAMQSDFCAMSEHSDNLQSIIDEVNACDNEILLIYADIYLN